MEYHSPLGHNYNLKESLSKREKNNSEPNRKSLPNFISLDSEDLKKKQFSFDNTQKSVKSNLYFDRSPSYGWDKKKRYSTSTNQKDRIEKVNSVCISDYYHPSMMEDPWRELEAKLSEN